MHPSELEDLVLGIPLPSVFTGLLASSLICSLFVAIHLLNLLYKIDICLETSNGNVSINESFLAGKRQMKMFNFWSTATTKNPKQLLLQQCFWCLKLLLLLSLFCGGRTTEESFFSLMVISKSKLRNPSRALWYLVDVLLIH